MNDLLLAQGAPAALSGAAALLCLVLSPLFRSRRTILIVQLTALLSFTLHYLCLNLEVAALANGLGAVQVVAALFAVGNKKVRELGYTLIGVMVLLSIWLWEGPLSGLGVLAMILTATARMQTDVVRLRTMFIIGISAWALHDWLAGAWMPFFADVGAALLAAAALVPQMLRNARLKRSPYVGRAVTWVASLGSRT